MASKKAKVAIAAVVVVAVAAVCIGLLVANGKAKTDEDSSGDSRPLPPAPSPRPWTEHMRLPASVQPIHYELYLYPDLETKLFTGRVDIFINSTEPRDHFLAHTKYLEIVTAKLYRSSIKDPDNEVDLLQTFEYEPNEFFVIMTNGDVSPGEYIMAFEFRGNLTKGITGFYLSEYNRADGSRARIATSKFQPTDARKAFPCFDEPTFKATFGVTLVRPSDGYIALSNMPVDKEVAESPAQGMTEVQFKKSVPMVTYLACFIVCDFEYQEKETNIHKTRFRVYATPSQRDTVKYALDIGANITDFFEDYFKIPYPLPKQDMAAIPDFVSGAMEHWGLITYRESNLLYDEKESSSANQQRVATVISHELAHQWFGNLVTLSWWDDLWLNEGFASYMEYKGVDNYHTDWDVDSQFLALDLFKVMVLDATLNSRPIVQTVETPDQITEIFDSISYSKGASVLRMLENFMGADRFRSGISHFLQRFKYGNAKTNDLWQDLNDVAQGGINVTNIMDTWTRQMGFPLVTVRRIKPNTYRVTQSRYLLDPSLADESASSPYNYRWEIPLTWITDRDSNNAKLEWLGRDQSHLDIDVPSDLSWVKFNVAHFGYYRVMYPDDDWNKLSKLLLDEHESLDAKDRGGLINDAFSLAESGHLGYSVAFSMVRYLKHENHLIPWRLALAKLNSVEELLRNTDAHPLFRKYMLSLLEEPYNRLGWTDVGPHGDRLLRGNILSSACRNGHDKCLAEAGTIFEEWIADGEKYVAPNIRTEVYRYGMASGGNRESWDIMLDRYLKEENAQEKRKMRLGLSYISDPEVLSYFLNLAQNETIVRSQDYFSVLTYISSNPKGTSIVWDFVRREWSAMVERFTLNNRYLGRVPKYTTESFNTVEQLQDVQDFFAEHPEAGAGERSRKQALESIQNNIRWLKDHKSDIYEWLVENVEA